ncbi:RNA polymerase sigma factor [Kineococcus esterisolvens]|uniref:RNA polymerase sigma factor n=1 Tax=unclassified Kineococcus TaxID=2621656 RepID=UPI003D7CCA7A
MSAADERVADLLARHAGDVLSYLRRRTADPEDAADVLSQTLTTAWRRSADLPADEEGARRWLFTVARGTLANHRRGRHRADDLSARLRSELAAAQRIADAAGPDHVADAVREAVGRLPAAQRELVMLVHWDGFTLVEAAAVTGVPASTARTRYATARVALARLLQGESTTAMQE